MKKRLIEVPFNRFINGMISFKGKKERNIMELNAMSVFIAQFCYSQKALSSFAQQMNDDLRKISPKGIISCRLKDVSSLIVKIQKKYSGKKTVDEFWNCITDLIGARVIVLSKTDIKVISEKIRERWEIRDYDSEDTGTRLNEREFGYQSCHFVVKCGIVSINKTNHPVFCEIQVRTMLQDVWAQLNHNEIYKTNLIVPPAMVREWNSLSAFFENIDNEIVDFFNRLNDFHRNENLYLTKGEIIQKQKSLQVIIRLLWTRNRKKAIPFLQEYIRFSSILYGLLPDKVSVNEEELEEEEYAEIRSALSKECSAWDEGSCDYSVAGDPFQFLCFIKSSNSLPKNEDVAWALLLKTNYETFKKMASVQTNTPWAYAGIVLCGFLLHEPEKDIWDALLRLINLCNAHTVCGFSAENMVSTAFAHHAILCLCACLQKLKILHSAQKNELRENMLIALDLGIYAHGIKNSAPSNSNQSSGKEYIECQWNQKGNKNEEVFQGDMQLKNYSDLPIKIVPDLLKEIRSSDDVVILAGGCENWTDDQSIKQCKELFCNALKGKRKIVLQTGNAEQGIGKIANSVKSRSVKYLIRYGKSNAKANSPATSNDLLFCVNGNSDGHSIREALAGWQHLQMKKYPFANVALVGMALGNISQLECKLALALGGRVTVLCAPDCKESKEKNFDSPDVAFWRNHSCFIKLPVLENGLPESVMLRMFMLYDHVEADTCSEYFTQIETLFNKQQDKSSKEKSDLQVFKICSLIYGMKYRTDIRDEKDPVKRYSGIHRCIALKKIMSDLNTTPEDALNDPKILCAFGEMEHARWYLERWLSGTRFGFNKIDNAVSNTQRKHPSMVAWSALPQNEKGKDTEYIARYVKALGVLKEIKRSKKSSDYMLYHQFVEGKTKN